MSGPRGATGVEWPTLALLALCYTVWGLGAWAPLWLGLPMVALAVALFSSLQHEAIHEHPTGNARLNAALVFPALTLVVPYIRFRDTHLDHHRNPNLTDPYDDPESNYLDPAVWSRLPRPVQWLLRFNNTLLGRMLLGTLIGTLVFLLHDTRAMRAGDRRVLRGWLWHLPALAPVALWLAWAPMTLGAYALAVYVGLSLIRVRTFVEHQAAEHRHDRTAIIEDRGLFAWLFLNNNLHVVHHMHPRVPWYRLPTLYFNNRARFVRHNGGYVYGSYREVFARYFLRAKDPVPHPHFRGSGPAE